MPRCGRAWGWCLAAAAAAGCAGTPTPPGTGTEQAVRGYFEALLRQDWAEAYAALDPGGRARCTPEQFARLAANYRRDLGLEPEAVAVRSCDERGAEAVAHVTIRGRAGARLRFYKDAITLRRGGAGWGVVLPANFGRGR